ncbi:phage tail assembly chaperone G [Bacillus norwichensis]|uniref:Phage protein n=1 Tax=Bacillus norwichensis TaxID=2762217 RepID=A0ABR8VM31_9BACI|nr:hypothetical protein [Bacillus norwichensis]MBD8005817.1 hypothetical protein [Bacillus norwichensis]
MQIELYIDGELKVFTTPFVPLRAKRLYLKVQMEAEKKAREDENYIPSYEEQMAEEDEIIGILANVVFGGQFTVDQVYDGASDEYVYKKLAEAIFNKSKEKSEEGNDQGK